MGRPEIRDKELKHFYFKWKVAFLHNHLIPGPVALRKAPSLVRFKIKSWEQKGLTELKSSKLRNTENFYGVHL